MLLQPTFVVLAKLKTKKFEDFVVAKTESFVLVLESKVPYYRRITTTTKTALKHLTNLHLLTMKNCSFVRFARALFIFAHFAAVPVQLTPWNAMLRSWVDDDSPWEQLFNILFLFPVGLYTDEIPGLYTFCKPDDLELSINNCRNAKLYFAKGVLPPIGYFSLEKFQQSW